MNSSNNDYLINNLNDAIEYMHKYVLPVIYILGNIGNFLSFLIFLKKSWKKNVCVFYFKFLLFFNSCYINSTILGSIFTFVFQINLQNSNIVLCKLYFYTSFLFLSISPTILLLASIDRLLISSQNVDTRLYSSKRLAYFSISISILFWIIFNLHALSMANIRESSPSYFACHHNLPPSYSDFITYFYGLLNVAYCLLMIVLCSFAFKNVRYIRMVKRENRTNQVRSMTKKDFQLLRCLFAQDTVYIFSSMLLLVSYIYQTVTRDQIRTSWEPALVNFFNAIVFIFYDVYFCSSFFVFIIVSKAFRQ
jgi:hypothetical protein